MVAFFYLKTLYIYAYNMYKLVNEQGQPTLL